jgi:hypothetical protein
MVCAEVSSGSINASIRGRLDRARAAEVGADAGVLTLSPYSLLRIDPDNELGIILP